MATDDETARDRGRTDPAAPSAPLVLDAMLPGWDASLARHTLVDARCHATYEAARTLDFARVEDPLVTAAAFLRGLPARLRTSGAPVPDRLALGAPGGLRGWTLLGLQADREVAFGAIGALGEPRSAWREVAAAQFAAFAEPGLIKLACGFVVAAYGTDRCVLTYECRVAATDVSARAQLLRYLELARPAVGYVLSATLRVLRADAERRPALVPGAEP